MLLDITYTGFETNRTGMLNAADYDGDCQPEVCIITQEETIGLIGPAGLEYSFTDSENQFFGLASADVDNDGAAEVFAIAENRRSKEIFIVRLDLNISLNRLEKTWESSQPFAQGGQTLNYKNLAPSIADFNTDSRPEIYLGNQIFDSQTGQFLGSAGLGNNIGGAENNRGELVGIYSSSVAIDILDDTACPDCSGLELVAGNQVFSVALNSTTNPSLNSVKTAVELSGFKDGVTAVADYDLDGDVDVVVANLNGTGATSGKVYIWDAQTPTQIGQSFYTDFSVINGVGVPAIGDLDGDSRPEIVINSKELLVLNDFQSGGSTNWGTDYLTTVANDYPLRDHHVGMTLFDFNGDGKQEIVLRNQFGFYVFDGELKIVGVSEDFQSFSELAETPVIIDWDNDQEAEIIIFGCPGLIFSPSCLSQITVISSGSFPWSNTRKIQNQYSFYNTNINDDGSVPIQQQSPHLLGSSSLNSFNQQYAIPKIEDCPEDEICTNGIDDDGDGLIDYYDPDCICVQDFSCSAPYYQTCTDDCISDNPFTNFSLTKNQSDIQVYWTSMLAANDFDGDCKTDLLAITKGNDLSIIDPITQTIKHQIESSSKGNFTTGDVDGDGMAEIFVNEIDSDDRQIYRIARYDFNPTINSLELTWISPQPIRFLPDDFVKLNGPPMLADFNGDGRPEVNIGNQIYDSQTGIELIYAGDNFNRGSSKGGIVNRTEGIKGSAIAADLLPDNACPNCTGLELAAGNQVFSVSINSYTDPSRNSIEVVRELPGYKDGFTSFVDFDVDGDLDIVVGDYFEEANNWMSRIYIWDAQTPTLIGNPILLPVPPGGLRLLPATIGDLDGNGFPEIIVNNGTLFVLNDYKNGGETNWGNNIAAAVGSSISSGDHSVGVTLFDFNLDGKQEIIIRNFAGLKLLDGNLNTLFFDPDNATTEYDYAFVADIDNDDEGELVTYICPGVTRGWEFTCGRLTIYESAAEPWANARKVWNQYSFFNTNINEDGSIPTNQQLGHLVTPALNSFNQQYAIPDSQTKCNDEICTNGIDDDGDGLIDFFDDDCPCIQDSGCGEPFYSICTENCNTPTPASNFPTKTIITPIDTDFNGFMGVADIDGDCQSDFVSLNIRNEIIFSDKNTVKGIFGTPSLTFGGFALGDIDNDGMAEILATATPVGTGAYNIVRLDWNPAVNALEQTWISPTIQRTSGVPSPTSLFPYLADFNKDGRPEIYSGSQIFDSQTGIQLAFTFGNTGEAPPEPDISKSYNTAIAADLLPDNACSTCTGLEIAAGNQIYAVDIKSYTDPSQNSISIVRELSGFRDGATAIADFDLDGDLDIIVANREGTTEIGLVYVWDGQTTSLVGQPLDFPIPSPQFFSRRKLTSGVPSIGDVDGDSRPEIVLHCSDILVLEDYQTGGGQNWGSNPSQTIRSTLSTGDHQNPTTLFDFDLDGKCEIVTMGNFLGLSILNENLEIIGGDSTTISRTGWQAPAIADYDDDGEAEIIIQANVNRNLINIKIHIFESDGIPWANARNLFTQHSHHSTHINDNGTVPAEMQNQILVDDVQLNSFNQVYALPNIKDCPEQENCLNGIDDDGDGLVDFFDDDCPCLDNPGCGAPFYSICNDNCNDSTSNFSIKTTSTSLLSNFSGFIGAADIDGDCQPDMVYTNIQEQIVVSNESGEKATSGSAGYNVGSFVLGDVDNDGMAEIIACYDEGFRGSLGLIRFDWNPATSTLIETWNIRQAIQTIEPVNINIPIGPSLADFNGDGRPEIYSGNQIFDSHTGVELVKGTGNLGTIPLIAPGRDITRVHNTAVAADLLPDNACPNCKGLELAAGNQIYAIDINSYSNPGANSISIERELSGFGDGTTAIADFDVDGDLDIVVTDMDGITSGILYVWDGQTNNLVGKPLNFPIPASIFSFDYTPTVPAIGDVDGDSKPEIVINNFDIIIIEDYETGGSQNWGVNPSQTIKTSFTTRDHPTAITLFDFDLDGKAEIVNLNFFNGFNIYDENLDIISGQSQVTSLSGFQAPMIVDYDNDDEAEVVVQGLGGIVFLESDGSSWANTRKVFTQFGHHNTHINDDGTVPADMQNQALVGNTQLNSFNQQYAFSNTGNCEEICDNGIDDDGDGLIDGADPDCPCQLAEAFAKIESATCGTDGIEFEFEICNDGDGDLPAETPITIYGGDPTQFNAPIKLTFELPDILPFGECFLLKKTITAGQDSLFIVVNDDGSLPRPFDLTTQFPTNNIEECDYTNNLSGSPIQFENPPPLDLGDDRLVCDNGIFELVANDGFESYRWFDGSVERSLTVFEPGTYWVDATDICGNVVTDTIVIETDPITEVKLGTDLTVCKGDTLEFDAGTFDNYKWLPKSPNDCDTCQIFKLKIKQDTQVIVTVSSDLGCFSTDTLDIFARQASLGFDTISICPGDTISVGNVSIFSDTTLSLNVASLTGCDSIIETTIMVGDTILKNEIREICEGESTSVFGIPISTDTILTQVYSRLNACDSTQQIEIIVRPKLFTEDEMQYCEGDTIMIFGVQVTDNDTLTQVFTSSIGCDSTSEIRVVFTNSINTDEALNLCAGDTIRVFGNEITSDTTLFETFNSVNGCDSTHEVQVRYRPQISGIETLTFCEGDTVMIFGNRVTQSDTVSEFLTAANGCDSLATVEVIFNQKSTTSESFEFCEGDTARIFGLEILKDTTVSETLLNAIGCDSTHIVEITFKQSIQTNDQQIFCEGDTANVFGLEIFRDTIVSQVLPSFGGCDSTITIEIIFNQTIETFEQLEFCAGDTAFVFGNAVTQDDTVSQIFNSAIGCDSTHNVDIVFLAEAEKMISESLCENDILLFFNDTISETGTYFKTIPAIDNGCDTNYVLTAEFFEDPSFTLVTDTLISIGESLEIPLNISDPTAQVIWQSNPLLSCENCLNPIVTISEATTFEAIITNAQGCSVIARINVRVVDDNGIYIPSAFSPNGDFNNDVFTVFSKEAKQIDQLQIFDRWGGILFELNDFMSNEPSIGWDGTSRDLPVNSGVYVYKFLIRNKEGKQEMFAGDVTVFR